MLHLLDEPTGLQLPALPTHHHHHHHNHHDAHDGARRKTNAGNIIMSLGIRELTEWLPIRVFEPQGSTCAEYISGILVLVIPLSTISLSRSLWIPCPTVRP